VLQSDAWLILLIEYALEIRLDRLVLVIIDDAIYICGVEHVHDIFLTIPSRTVFRSFTVASVCYKSIIVVDLGHEKVVLVTARSVGEYILSLTKSVPSWFSNSFEKARPSGSFKPKGPMANVPSRWLVYGDKEVRHLYVFVSIEATQS